MGRESGRFGRFLGRLFRERQIYHRSDGIVRFVKLTTNTQLALATVTLAALGWVAYASVNVVFKEQIIVAKDKESRNTEAAYKRELFQAQKANEGERALNIILSQEWDAAFAQMENNHQTLEETVQQRSYVDKEYKALQDRLRENGNLGGKAMENGNRVMVDPVGREVTPRRSRIAKLSRETLDQVLVSELSNGVDNELLTKIRARTAEHSARQVLLLAQIEADVRREIEEVNMIMRSTGMNHTAVVRTARARFEATSERQATAATVGEDNEFFAQGGPFIPLDDEETVQGSPVFNEMAARVDIAMQELRLLRDVLDDLPISSPLRAKNRMTSPYGPRWDPINRTRRAMHKGQDWHAARNSPILATAPGRVKYAGRRGAFGNMVEIDHGNGFTTRYAHMSKVTVRSGQKVELHQQIGKLGSTGKSTGPHIHYEILYKGRQVDPKNFLKAGRYVFES